MTTPAERQRAAALLIESDDPPLAIRETELGGVVIVKANGQKVTFTPGEYVVALDRARAQDRESRIIHAQVTPKRKKP